MSEFHFNSIDPDTIIFREEEILKLAQQIRAIVEKIGIDEFCRRIKESLERHTGNYPICGLMLEDMKCDNMNK